MVEITLYTEQVNNGEFANWPYDNSANPLYNQKMNEIKIDHINADIVETIDDNGLSDTTNRQTRNKEHLDFYGWVEDDNVVPIEIFGPITKNTNYKTMWKNVNVYCSIDKSEITGLGEVITVTYWAVVGNELINDTRLFSVECDSNYIDGKIPIPMTPLDKNKPLSTSFKIKRNQQDSDRNISLFVKFKALTINNENYFIKSNVVTITQEKRPNYILEFKKNPPSDSILSADEGGTIELTSYITNGVNGPRQEISEDEIEIVSYDYGEEDKISFLDDPLNWQQPFIPEDREIKWVIDYEKNNDNKIKEADFGVRTKSNSKYGKLKIECLTADAAHYTQEANVEEPEVYTLKLRVKPQELATESIPSNGIVNEDAQTDEEKRTLQIIASIVNGNGEIQNLNIANDITISHNGNIQFEDDTTTTTLVNNEVVWQGVIAENNSTENVLQTIFSAIHNSATYGNLTSNEITLNQIPKGQTRIPDCDYFVFNYEWTEGDGKDLDSFTVIKVYDSNHQEKADIPFVNKPLGYGFPLNSPLINNNLIIMKHSGDNRDSGGEGAIVCFSNIVKGDLILLTDTVEINIYANWYGVKYDGNMAINCLCYKHIGADDPDYDLDIEETIHQNNIGSTYVSFSNTSNAEQVWSEKYQNIHVNARGIYNASNVMLSQNCVDMTYSHVATIEIKNDGKIKMVKPRSSNDTDYGVDNDAHTTSIAYTYTTEAEAQAREVAGSIYIDNLNKEGDSVVIDNLKFKTWLRDSNDNIVDNQDVVIETIKFKTTDSISGIDLVLDRLYTSADTGFSQIKTLKLSKNQDDTLKLEVEIDKNPTEITRKLEFVVTSSRNIFNTYNQCKYPLTRYIYLQQ